MSEDRLPTGLWVEIHLRNLEATGAYYYFIQKGNHSSGLVLLKINGLKGEVKLLAQERNFENGNLEWINALSSELVKESEADEYIHRSISRDPDLWVLEIEDTEMKNPLLD